ncbi:50S ribosomal protein L3 N(5)-glutamine methyltransferase [Aquella oligotrophica]|uniref:50S ribosomal protein L3 N(5)-glutamine methyltransferase n=1 Tax=Aquella oligotrophica TaxID=2067065 RepID=A0A2I7N8C5_9NEIS|nr:50S ribosomal protein L3 N(5)-glutamine methyltransferase [Aquella oligotrophica]AUR52485.1 50S ribosomal protein L3 N(5)-glutamine methyltransferase [Aquella oligotrophica]
MTESLVTLRDYIRYAVSEFRRNNLFFGHGTTNAYDEAVFLVLQSLSLPLEQLEPFFDARLLPEEKAIILERIKRRVDERIPLSYITNEAYLQGYSFYVDKRVIIPRSFIAEHIVNNQLDEWIEHPELVNNVLDLCTGNGSLATIAAHHYYDAEIVASDISEDALDVASINIERNQVTDRVTLIKSDLFNELGDYFETFDLILTNPPYVDTRRMESLPKEYLYEPNLALFGGTDGLEFVDKILKQSKYYLSDFGVLVVEMGDNRFELEQMYPDLPFKWLESVSGDGVVFVLTKADLIDYFD